MSKVKNWSIFAQITLGKLHQHVAQACAGSGGLTNCHLLS